MKLHMWIDRKMHLLTDQRYNRVTFSIRGVMATKDASSLGMQIESYGNNILAKCYKLLHLA